MHTIFECPSGVSIECPSAVSIDKLNMYQLFKLSRCTQHLIFREYIVEYLRRILIVTVSFILLLSTSNEVLGDKIYYITV